MLWRLLSQVDIDPSELEIPQGTLNDNSTIETGLQVVFAIAGAVALLVIVISGLRYTLSQGDPQTTAKAKNAIIYAAIGLVLSMLGFAIVRFVVGRVG